MNLNESNTTLKDEVKAFRPAVLARMKSGAELISRLENRNLEKLLKVSREFVSSSLNVDENELASEFKVGREDVISIISFSTFITYILSSGKYSLEDISRELVETELATPETMFALSAFIKLVIGEQPKVKQEFEQRSIASSVLPSLNSIEMAVDLRLKFDGDNVTSFSPITIVHLDTDSESQLIWFQMTKVQIERLIFDLQKSLERMNSADKYFNQSSKNDNS